MPEPPIRAAAADAPTQFYRREATHDDFLEYHACAACAASNTFEDISIYPACAFISSHAAPSRFSRPRRRGVHDAIGSEMPPCARAGGKYLSGCLVHAAAIFSRRAAGAGRALRATSLPASLAAAHDEATMLLLD